jgi:L-asparaginase II
VNAPPLVVEVERSGLIESVHLVDVAVVDVDGGLTAFAGDPSAVSYLRSSAKPVQATACLEAGWEPPGIGQIALACGSHNGEPEHVNTARVTLEAAGVDPSALRCPAAWPFRMVDAARAGAAGPIFHNCSGKHAAMLATAQANGWPLSVSQKLVKVFRLKDTGFGRNLLENFSGSLRPGICYK